MPVYVMLLTVALIVGIAGLAKQINEIVQEDKEKRRKKFPGAR